MVVRRLVVPLQARVRVEEKVELRRVRDNGVHHRPRHDVAAAVGVAGVVGGGEDCFVYFVLGLVGFRWVLGGGGGVSESPADGSAASPSGVENGDRLTARAVALEHDHKGDGRVVALLELGAGLVLLLRGVFGGEGERGGRVRGWGVALRVSTRSTSSRIVRH